jgi:AcrR family transcriptional regulator
LAVLAIIWTVSEVGITERPRRGRPRSQRARDAILDAAGELVLARGVQDVSVDAVAETAGVSKATIYRWWPTKDALVLDALYRDWDTGLDSPRDTGSLRGDFLALLRPWVRLVRARPYARVIAALITEAQTDPGFGQRYQERFLEPRRAASRALFTRAIERGEIAPNFRVELGLDLIYGPVYHRLLHGHAPLSDGFVRDVVDSAIAGGAPRGKTTRRRPQRP